MNEEIKSQWVAALRSGEYQQTKGWLHVRGSEGDGFCCLGVLCDLATKAGVVEPNVSDFGDVVRYGTHNETKSPASAVLPVEVIEWSGMADSCGVLPGGDDLAQRNDAGASFDEIATIIEENL